VTSPKGFLSDGNTTLPSSPTIRCAAADFAELVISSQNGGRCG
jgi:hypothetical protein